MKYSFNLGQYYSKVDLKKILSLSKAELAEKLNSQIGAFDEITYLGEQYTGIYVAKIVKCSKHPDADKLQVCLIDDGGANLEVQRNEQGLIQVVCGAPNARAGIFVAWIPPGATVPATINDPEPFKLSVAKLRGVQSHGMLASKKELNLSSEHSGILELSLTPTQSEIESAPLQKERGPGVFSASRKEFYSELKSRARESRKTPTPAEELLWQEIRSSKLGVKFRRQHPIDLYIVDFFCVELNLIIEVDGEYHQSKDQKDYDEERTYNLSARGSEILRFTNQQVLEETEKVLAEIKFKAAELQAVKPSLVPGTTLSEWRGVRGEAILNDVIVDFENKMFTHRPDCFGHIGISREIAAIQGLKFKSPDWFSNPARLPDPSAKLNIQIQTENCSRYRATIIEDVQAQPSPAWLQSSLRNLDLKPINNLVDVTNYMMILTAQPQHAFDLDKIKKITNSDSVEIIIRNAEEGEELILLGGKTIKLNSADVVIATPQKAIALAGVMGGLETEVDENTKNILLETATFDMYSIRRTSMRHGLFTDAVTRYTKNQPNTLIDPVAAKTISEYKELASGKATASSVVGEIQQSKPLSLNIQNLNKILGTNLSLAEVQEILSRVEIPTSATSENELQITPPFWRQDLEIEEDLIEEVGRIYGFNNIEAKLPTRSAKPPRTNQMLDLKSTIREKLSKLGANEVLTYNFVNAKLLEHAKQDPSRAYKIRNALSPNLEHYRLSLIPNLLEKIHPNIKSGYNSFALFEMGKCHIKDHLESEAGLPAEFQRLSFIYSSKQDLKDSAYFAAKKYLSSLLTKLNLQYKFIPLPPEMFGTNIPITSVYAPSRSAGVEIEDELRGIIGEFDDEVSKNFKLPKSSAGFELDLAWLADKFSLNPNYKPLQKFPSITQDYTIATPTDESYEQTLIDFQNKLESQFKKSEIKFSVSPVSIYQKSKEDSKNTTFSVEFWHNERTLSTKELSLNI